MENMVLTEGPFTL